MPSLLASSLFGVRIATPVKSATVTISGMRLSPQEIKRLCGLWKNSAVSANGIGLGPQSEQYRLHRNNIGFHELDYDELRTACVELTKLLLLPGVNTIIDFDHFLLWAWCSELLIGQNGPLSTIDQEVYTLAQTTTRAALAHANYPSRESFERVRQADELLNNNAREFLRNSSVALSYLCFPLLEAIARRACNTFVDLNGVVQQPFPRSNGSQYQVNSRCSNVGDVLRVLRDQAADRALQSDLDEVLSHIAGIVGSTDGYSAVFVWRNSSLHGETTQQTIGGTIYTLAILIALNSIGNDYAQFRDDAVTRVNAERNRGHPSPWSFYPPF